MGGSCFGRGTGVFENLVGSRCPPGGGFSGRFRKEGTRAVIADPGAWSRRCKEVAQLGEVPLSMKAVGCGTLGAALLDPAATFGATQVELLTHFGAARLARAREPRTSTGFAQAGAARAGAGSRRSCST